MAGDRYTKAVLTVIAVCLVWLSLGGPSLVSPASAQTSGHERVVLYGWVDQAGIERRFPFAAYMDDRPQTREAPRALPVGSGW